MAYKNNSTIFILSLLIFLKIATASEVTEQGQYINTNTSTSTSTKSKLTAYKPNHVMINYSEKDDEKLQIRLSVQYEFFDCDEADTEATRKDCNLALLPGNHSFSFSYTTDFDFYVLGNSRLARPSEPVVNRMTSPGFHLQGKGFKNPSSLCFFGLENCKLNSYLLSIVHQSNGQTSDESTYQLEGLSPEAINRRVESLDRSTPWWRDNISRSWDYAEIKMHWFLGAYKEKCKYDFSCNSLYLGLKVPLRVTEDEIWWEEANDTKYTDYNAIEIIIQNEWVNLKNKDLSKEYSFQLLCGTTKCSLNARYRHDFTLFGITVPAMIYSHIGPNEHFYNYQEVNNTVGIGLQFRP